MKILNHFLNTFKSWWEAEKENYILKRNIAFLKKWNEEKNLHEVLSHRRREIESIEKRLNTLTL